MPTSRVTSKGQITLPKSIREALGVRPGDRVHFVQHHDGRITVEAQNGDLLSLLGSVRTDVRGVTLEDMEEAIAEGALASAGFPADRDARGDGASDAQPVAGQPRRRDRRAGRTAR